MKRIPARLFLCIVVLLLGSGLHAQIITTIAGGATGHAGYWGDGGPATAAQMGLFSGIAVDKWNNVYIADGNNHRVRKVNNLTGIITTIAGTGVGGYNGDGIPASSAQLNKPGLLCVDSSGNLYINEAIGNRIRKVDVTTGMISTFAGNGIFGFSGDGGPATAANCDFQGFTFDVFGNMIIEASAHHRIRKIDPTGIITTIAGTGIPGSSGDGGPATAATMAPFGLSICTDRFGNIYFPDTLSSLRKINVTTGIITRVAGAGDGISYPYSGDGGAATATHLDPIAVIVDDTGNIYIGDPPNSRIEKVDTFGIIHTIAGTGIQGFSGDGGLPTLAQFDHPRVVVLDKCNNIYVSDFENVRVRKITYRPSCDPSLNIEPNKPSKSISIYPNPTNNIIHIDNVTTNYNYSLLNIVGSIQQQGVLQAGNNEVNINSISPGLYLLELEDPLSKQRIINRIIKE